MKELHTEIEIDASPEDVWRVLTDFDKYPEWNSFIKSASGEITVGEKLQVYIEPPNKKGMTFRPTVKRVVQIKNFVGWVVYYFLEYLMVSIFL